MYHWLVTLPSHTHTHTQAKKDGQMLKRRNVDIGPETPLTECNKQVMTIFNTYGVVVSSWPRIHTNKVYVSWGL